MLHSFNSYTQQICIDDAVIVGPDQQENVIDNLGTTPSILAAKSHVESAYLRMPGNAASLQHELGPSKLAKEQNSNSIGIERDPKKVAIDERAFKQAVTGAVATTFTEATSRSQTTKRPIENGASEIAADSIMQVRDEIGTAQRLPWTLSQARGPPQVVTHTSKFVNKLSEITDDMNISGSLAIKYNAIGGSGKGSFLDAEKFYDSDLNYYISVKVINQTLNYKDPLTFNPLRSCMTDKTRFDQTFGDTFISGFLEGGELNAVVSIKIHNKSKRREIEAEAKVALTAGPVEVSAQGNIKLAEENVALNAETNIYVSWSGGGNIKPYDAGWTIQSLTRAAARFPSLVALRPQRIYATLTKYESLRSYLSAKPVKLSPLKYENVQVYTSAMLDAYMTYKTMSQRLGVEMQEVSTGARGFSSSSEHRPPIESTGSLRRAGLDYFPCSIYGLEQARRAIRRQMNLISREVDAVASNPALGCDPSREPPYVSPMSMQMLIPLTELSPDRRRKNNNPLSNQRLNPLVSGADIEVEQGSEARALCDEDPKSGRLTVSEAQTVARMEDETWGIGNSYRMTTPVGSMTFGQDALEFCTLEYASKEPVVTDIRAVNRDGTLCGIHIGFASGLWCGFGAAAESVTEQEPRFAITGLTAEDPVFGGTIQVVRGREDGTERVVGVYLKTGKGTLDARCQAVFSNEEMISQDFDNAFHAGHLAGLWGTASNHPGNEALIRLGFIWGNTSNAGVCLMFKVWSPLD